MNTKETIGKYRVLRTLGVGGMGTVHLAHDPTLNRNVAVKVLADHFAQDPTTAARFLNEARAIAALQHPGIVSVYEAGTDDGKPYFAMEYVEGEDLASVLTVSGALPLANAQPLLAQIAAALDYAHRRGIVHRDVKPANILVTSEGQVKVSDFGIAKVSGESGQTMVGMIIGTPDYMAPELWNGKSATAASDQYALGVMAWEMLSGKIPYEGDTPLTKGFAHTNHAIPSVALPLPNPKLASRVNQALARAMAKSPDDRFPSAEAFVAELREVSEPPSPERRGRRGPLTVAYAAIGIAVVLIGAGLLRGAAASTEAPKRNSQTLNAATGTPKPIQPRETFPPEAVSRAYGEANRIITKLYGSEKALPDQEKLLHELDEHAETLTSVVAPMDQESQAQRFIARGTYARGYAAVQRLLSLLDRRDAKIIKSATKEEAEQTEIAVSAFCSLLNDYVEVTVTASELAMMKQLILVMKSPVNYRSRRISELSKLIRRREMAGKS